MAPNATGINRNKIVYLPYPTAFFGGPRTIRERLRAFLRLFASGRFRPRFSRREYTPEEALEGIQDGSLLYLGGSALYDTERVRQVVRRNLNDLNAGTVAEMQGLLQMHGLQYDAHKVAYVKNTPRANHWRAALMRTRNQSMTLRNARLTPDQYAEWRRYFGINQPSLKTFKPPPPTWQSPPPAPSPSHSRSRSHRSQSLNKSGQMHAPKSR
jgi:hypothetical protein